MLLHGSQKEWICPRQALWNSTRQRLTLTIWVTMVVGWLSAGVLLAQDDSTRERRHRLFLEKRQQILQAFQADLHSLQQWCQQEGVQDGAVRVSELASALSHDQTDSSLPRFVESPVSSQLPLPEQQWRLQLKHHRTERAKELYSAARSALRAGFPSLAFSMIGDVVRIDPDHHWARSVLGYQLLSDPTRSADSAYAGEWVSVFEARMRRSSPPNVYDRRFGWIPAASLPRYEQGLRPWQGNWISEVKEAELRRDFRNAWEVRSEHFLIRTNVSLQAGVELSEQLELFYSWMQQNFAAFFDTPEAMKERFEEATTRRSSRRPPAPMQVHYYATQEEYQRRVRDKVPANVQTNGLYWQPDRTCYFFAKSDPTDRSTLFHEATHQILDLATIEQRLLASRQRARKLNQKSPAEWILCEKSNFWIIEGLACYCESFEIVDGRISIGRPDYVRFDTARQRMLDPDLFFFIPFSQFFALGKDTFQLHPNVSQFYTQASGTVHFLMHYDDGVYRDSFIKLLSAIYRPDGDDIMQEPSFERIAEVSSELLERQYRQHMQNLENQILSTGTQP